jgi:hypothetical protein
MSPESAEADRGSPRKSRIVAAGLAVLAVGWAIFLFAGMPFIYGKKVEALVGQPRSVIDDQLGKATREWPPDGFACDPRFSCDSAKARGGPVLLYADNVNTQAWYLYFDPQGSLAAVQRSVSPDYDGGVPP